MARKQRDPAEVPAARAHTAGREPVEPGPATDVDDITTPVTSAAAPDTTEQSQQAMQADDKDLASAFDDVDDKDQSATTDESASTSTEGEAPEPVTVKLGVGPEIDLGVLEAALNGDARAWNIIREINGQPAMTPDEQAAYETLDGVPLNQLLALERAVQLGVIETSDADAFQAVLARRATDLEIEGALDLVAADLFKDAEALSEFYMAGSGVGLTDAEKQVVEDGGGAGVRDLLGIDRQQQLLGGGGVAEMLGGESLASTWVAEELADRTAVVNAEVDAVVMKALNGDAEAYIQLRALYGLETTQVQLDQYVAAGGVTAAEALGFARQVALLGSDSSPIMDAVNARLGTIGTLAARALDGDTTALAQIGAAIPDATITPEMLTGIIGLGGGLPGGTTPTTTTSPSATDTPTATTPVNPVDAVLDRMGDGSGAGSTPSSPSSPTSPAVGGDDTSTPQAPSPTEPGGPVEFNPDDTATRAADNLADWADGIAGRIGATGSGGDGSTAGLSTGTNQGPTMARPDAVVELGEVDDAGSAGVSTRGTTADGRGYTEYNWGDQGTQRVYDDGKYQWYNPDGTPKGEEVDTTSSEAGAETNPYEGTTDDDEKDDPDGDDDDTDDTADDDSGTATAYVNPDADPVMISISPVVAQLIVTGVDPTTTTPSGPYLDDSPTPLVVTTGTADVGLGVPVHPGVIDGNPEMFETVLGSLPTGLDPEGPDTIDPTDPVLGGGGEDINPGDFTPRPSVAFTSLMGDGPPDDGFDPDPFD